MSAETITDETDSVIVDVRLRSGKFHSTIEVPLLCSKPQRDAFVEAWLNLMAVGLGAASDHRPRVA